MMNLRTNLAALIRAMAALSLLLGATAVHAQTSANQCTSATSSSSSSTVTAYSEDFTCNTTNNQWFFYNGACLTAGANTSLTSPGYLPSCQSVLTSYYNVANVLTGKQADAYLSGGYYGYLGGTAAPTTPTAQVADPIINKVGHGALRFTNANGNGTNSGYGHHENGAIVSNFWFPSTQGVQITFKTATYYGDGGGTGADGADGISFYLLDACMPLAGATTTPPGCATSTYAKAYGTSGTFPGIGAWGGSLAYTCSNSNPPYDGLVGAYLGLGIDEYGNFLNGTSNTLGETDYVGTSPDNTASGGFYKPGRIGLRGAGSISWQALTNAYGNGGIPPSNTSAPYYPASLLTSCSSGTYSSTAGGCVTCSSGTYFASTNACNSCSSGTLNTTTGNCDGVCTGGGTFESDGQSPGTCYTCSNASSTLHKSGSTGNYSCRTPSSTLTNPSPSNGVAPSTTAFGAGVSYALTAVQHTCATGTLWNYSNLSNPANAGATSLSNALNTAGIMDYPAVINTATTPATPGYTVLSGVQIANEGSPYREGSPAGCTVAAGNCNTNGATTNPIVYSPATPITYKLKITPDGLLSFQYSVNGGTYQKVLDSMPFTASNGAMPGYMRFGFAGSDGGASNVHEIMCFKASPSETANTSGSVTVYQNPTVRTGAQIYTAFYNPGDWSGQLEAQPILFDTTNNVLTVQATPTWDARCVLTGVDATTGACSTGATSMSAESPAATGTGRQIFTFNGSGVPFEWTNLSAPQQTALGVSSRLDYLRGVRTSELNALQPSGIYRNRTSVLSDIVDASPVWVGPPQTYTAVGTWVDNLNATTSQAENTGTSYASFASTTATGGEGSRTNVVYVGANDGFVHGFRAGSLDANGNMVTGGTAPLNDGHEVMAYMPAAVLATIHNSNTALDYSNTLYSHNWFVDATPGTGDLYYAGGWHTWLVGGLGAGGAALYALNVTDPSIYTESTSNAASLVIGEWNSSNLTCAAPAGSCGQYLGNTFGTPEIRRFHSGDWGVIIGNGFGSSNGTGGVFIMLVNHNTGVPSFYFLNTSTSGTGNGIASAGSLDVDLDHVVDYIYAGDLKGNVWRWDVTSSTPATWASTAPFKLFTTPGGASQPITTRVTAGTLKTITSTVTLSGQTLSFAPERVIVNFGTGQYTPQTTLTPATYASGQQYLFGLWDWNMGTSGVANSGWNALTGASQQALSVPTSSGPGTITSTGSLQVQTITTTAAASSTQVATRSVSKTAIDWTSKYGWFIALPATNEQVIYDPVISPDGELVVNTYIPVNDSPLTCTTANATGFSMALQPDSGGGSPTPYFTVFSNGNAQVDGVQLNGTGTPSFLSSGQQSDSNAEYMLTQTNSGAANPIKINRHSIINGQRLNWTQRR
jgi:type IV pilus assembly protein PilY1